MGTFTIRPAEQQDVIDSLNDTNIKNTINALAPNSGYTKVSKKLDNFVFQTSSSFLNKVADKNRFIKFGDKVVDTYGPELVTNGDFSNGTTGWTTASGTASSIVDGKLKLVDTSSGAAVVFYKTIPTEIGKTYILTFYKENINATTYCSCSLEAISLFSSDTSVSGVGVFYKIYVATLTSTLVRIFLDYTGSQHYAYFDNISVREIQTADFTNTVPDVAEVITNGSNVTSVAVSAGDYVVVSPIKLNNSTFDTDLSGWNNSNNFWQYDSTNKRAFLPSTSDGSNSLSQMYTLTTGIRYRVRYSITIVSGGADVYIGGVKYSYTASISVDTVITGNGSTSGVSFIRRYDSGSGSFYVDNVYIDEVSDTFRAKQDAPIGTALTNTTYFEDRTQIGVTNQALAYHAYNTLTNAYEGIKTEVLFSDISKEDLLDNSVWMSSNGFSKVSQFLYSKGSYNDLVSGQYTTLNKGLFHPLLNYMGTRKASDDKYWYDTTVSFTSVADCFNPTKLLIASGYVASGKSGRPTGDATLYYDVCYPSLYQDVREYAKVLNKYEVDLIIADKEENGVEEVVSLKNYNYDFRPAYTAIGVSKTASFDGVDYRENKIYIVVNNIGFIVESAYMLFVSPNTTISSTYPRFSELRSALISSGIAEYTWGKASASASISTKPILSSNTKLQPKVISSPTYYSQVMKDKLASGVGIVGLLPDLVDDTGASNIPNGSKTVFKLNGKFTTTHQVLKSTDSGSTWSLLALTTHYTVNTTTNSITFVTAPASTDMILIADTDKCLPYLKKVITGYEVTNEDNFVYASNNGDITLKVPVLINNVTGKVSTGTSAIEKLFVTKEVNNIVYQTAKTATVDSTIRKFTATKDGNTFAGLRYNNGDTATIDLSNINVALLPINGSIV